MTAQHDLDRQLSDFLQEGPTQLPDASFDVVRHRTEQTRQRVVLGPWRFPEMNKFLAIGLGAAAVIAVLLVGPNLLPSSGTGPGGQPTLSAEPSAAAATGGPTSDPDGSLPEGPFVVIDPAAPQGSPRFTVNVPAPGWKSQPASGALAKGEDADPPEATVLFWTWPAGTGFDVFGDPCNWESTRPATPAASVDQIAAALAAQASRAASEPADVTVGGYAGKSITLHVPADGPGSRFADCDGGTFASYAIRGAGEGVDGLARTHQGPGQVDELWILDVEGAIVIIDAMSRPDTSDELIEEMRTIVESTTFGPN